VTGAVAGLALLATLSASLSGALSAVEGREAAAITFVVAASGLTFLGIGAAFWALAAGLLIRAVLPKPASAVMPTVESRPGDPLAADIPGTDSGLRRSMGDN
jgi:benzoate membrane transport protein